MEKEKTVESKTFKIGNKGAFVEVLKFNKNKQYLIKTPYGEVLLLKKTAQQLIEVLTKLIK